jgi:hypothetical protein
MAGLANCHEIVVEYKRLICWIVHTNGHELALGLGREIGADISQAHG